jgi:hypothetical protein
MVSICPNLLKRRKRLSSEWLSAPPLVLHLAFTSDETPIPSRVARSSSDSSPPSSPPKASARVLWTQHPGDQASSSASEA